MFNFKGLLQYSTDKPSIPNEVIQHYKDNLSIYNKLYFYNETKHHSELVANNYKWINKYYNGKLIYSYIINKFSPDRIFIKLNLDDTLLNPNIRLFIRGIQHIIRISMYAKNIAYIDSEFQTKDFYKILIKININVVYILLKYTYTSEIPLSNIVYEHYLILSIKQDKLDAFNKIIKYNKYNINYSENVLYCLLTKTITNTITDTKTITDYKLDFEFLLDVKRINLINKLLNSNTVAILESESNLKLFVDILSIDKNIFYIFSIKYMHILLENDNILNEMILTTIYTKDIDMKFLNYCLENSLLELVINNSYIINHSKYIDIYSYCLQIAPELIIKKYFNKSLFFKLMTNINNKQIIFSIYTLNRDLYYELLTKKTIIEKLLLNKYNEIDTIFIHNLCKVSIIPTYLHYMHIIDSKLIYIQLISIVNDILFEQNIKFDSFKQYIPENYIIDYKNYCKYSKDKLNLTKLPFDYRIYFVKTYIIPSIKDVCRIHDIFMLNIVSHPNVFLSLFNKNKEFISIQLDTTLIEYIRHLNNIIPDFKLFINDKPYSESLDIVYFSNEYHIKYLIKYIRLIRMIFNRCNIGKYLHIQILKLAYSPFCIKLMNKYLC